jgi:ZIP family zinc transporter
MDGVLQGAAGGGKGMSRIRLILFALLPLVLLGAMIGFFLSSETLLLGPSPVPPEALQRLTFERMAFYPGEIVVGVRNTGPGPARIGQVLVNDAIWNFDVTPGPELNRLARATVTVPYDWVAGEPHEVKLITDAGLVFKKQVHVTTETPVPGWRYFGLFALLGIYVGVIPVFLGLLWFPFLTTLRGGWMEGLLSFTVGLLAFLGLDALKEAFEAVEQLGPIFKGEAVILLGLLGTFLGLVALGQRRKEGEKEVAPSGLRLAYLIALGIGLHNLGEGLAIGAAYQLGEVALGAFLVLGFAIHNTTEGLAIVSPILRATPPRYHFLLLGLVAGVPTIAGTWIGGLTYSVLMAILFLAIGAGAIFQVIYEIVRFQARGKPVLHVLATPHNLVGLGLGFLVMYVTGLWVAV